MAKRYRPVLRDQPFLLPPDMREWLPAGHPVHLVIAVVEDHLDTSAFHAGRRAGGAGAAGYDPDMMVTLLVWAYAHGVTSSRRIEELCGTDVAFRLICGGNRPDHASVARFRAASGGAAGEFFAQVLVLCAELGMGRLGVVALDGTKVAASASKSANRTRERLRELAGQAAAAHAAADAAEDALFGQAAGDEVPEDAWRAGRRGERIAAALASLDAEAAAADAARQAKAEEYVEAARAGTPRAGHQPAEAGAELAELALARKIAAQQARIDAWHARQAARAAAGRKRQPGPPPADPAGYCRVKEAAAQVTRARARAAAAAQQQEQQQEQERKDRNRKGPGPVRNITDPHSRLMPVRGGGFIQGYNAQNVTSSDGLIIATALTASTTDAPWFEPMLRKAEDAAALITAHHPATPGTATPGTPAADDSSGDSQPGPDAAPRYAGPIGLILADAGYCSEANLTCPGPDRLIATGKHRDLEKAARDPAAASTPAAGHATRAMTERLRTEDGITAYRQRGHIAETPHGHIKHNMRFRQLSVRGTPRATAEWTFTVTVHNLLKAITTGHLTPDTLTTLTTRPA
jgi:transposase